MGRRGPPPKPTALKLVSGNPGGRPLNQAEPVPPAGAPDTPAFADERALAVWQQLVPRLSRIGLARTTDGQALERYCVLLVHWRDAAAFVAKFGSVYQAKRPRKKKAKGARATEADVEIDPFRPFPQVAILARLNRELVMLEREFGLTPASRSRITVDTAAGVKGDVNELKKKFFNPSAAATQTRGA